MFKSSNRGRMYRTVCDQNLELEKRCPKIDVLKPKCGCMYARAFVDDFVKNYFFCSNTLVTYDLKLLR